MMSGSLQYQLENGAVILDTISRRDVADELRALNFQNNIPTDEELQNFDEFMRAPMSKEKLRTMQRDKMQSVLTKDDRETGTLCGMDSSKPVPFVEVNE